jgi:hypothetical protein
MAPMDKTSCNRSDLRPVVKEKLPVLDTGVLPSAHASAATVSPTFPAAQADAMLRCNATYEASDRERIESLSHDARVSEK